MKWVSRRRKDSGEVKLHLRKAGKGIWGHMAGDEDVGMDELDRLSGGEKAST